MPVVDKKRSEQLHGRLSMLEQTAHVLIALYRYSNDAVYALRLL